MYYYILCQPFREQNYAENSLYLSFCLGYISNLTNYCWTGTNTVLSLTWLGADIQNNWNKRKHLENEEKSWN